MWAVNCGQRKEVVVDLKFYICNTIPMYVYLLITSLFFLSFISMKSQMACVELVPAFVFLQLLLAAFNIGFSSGSTCIDSERQALLRFKQDLTDPSNRLASWSADHGDCCQWTGVVCDNHTGHVLQLHLSNPYAAAYFTSTYFYKEDKEIYERSRLGGKINPLLLDLKEMVHLDLSYNNFQGIQIPKFFGSMKNLRHLNLSLTGFSGTIPHQLGNLSNLQSLALMDNGSYYYQGLHVENLQWLSNLGLLKHIDLSNIDLSNISSQCLSVISSLPSLEDLTLSNCGLQASPHQSIANFSSLISLDLSYNYLDNFFPNWVFGLHKLKFLSFGQNNFRGPIPKGLQNLTCLTHLDLSSNQFNTCIPDWLSRMNHLEYLSLSSNNLEGSIPDFLGNLTSLTTLDFSANQLQGYIPSLLGNLISLTTLDLSFNNFQGSIPSSLGDLTFLTVLDLTGNPLQGKIPKSLGKLCNLRSISLSNVDLHSNISELLDIFSQCGSVKLKMLNIQGSRLYGHLTDKIGRFRNLETLLLSNNSIDGPIPPSLWELSSLKVLSLSENKLNATVSEIHLSSLTKLQDLSLGENSKVVVEVSSSFIPPFQLWSLNLRYCCLVHGFPSWIRTQKFLRYLDISNCGISDTILNWFWNSLAQYSSVNIAHNQINQKIPNLTNSVGELDLSSNQFFGELPQIRFDVVSSIDLSNNSFSGSIVQFLCYGMNESRITQYLILDNNHLSGELPECGWTNWQKMQVLHLGNNHFSGKLPLSLGNLTGLESLVITRNNFSGPVPIESLKNCTHLRILDASENHFVGNAAWILQRFEWMTILNLRSNNFYGSLPTELCGLSSLQFLDLSNNQFSGKIPSCVNNLTAMVVSAPRYDYNDIFYVKGGGVDVGERALLMRNGMRYDYSAILNLVRAIDLSNNNFSGDISQEILSLRGLWWLNLSHNSLTGRIPKSIGAMGEIDSIDFSENQLSGEIPQSITNLTKLSFFNVSNNKLTGRIPVGTQMLSLNASCFTSNDLHGCPLPIDCDMPVYTPDHKRGSFDRDSMNGDHKPEINGFYISMILGFVVGFWGFIGPLVINRRCRRVYFNFLNDLGDRIFFVAKGIW